MSKSIDNISIASHEHRDGHPEIRYYTWITRAIHYDTSLI
jgi:hypothetical protein